MMSHATTDTDLQLDDFGQVHTGVRPPQRAHPPGCPLWEGLPAADALGRGCWPCLFWNSLQRHRERSGGCLGAETPEVPPHVSSSPFPWSPAGRGQPRGQSVPLGVEPGVWGQRGEAKRCWPLSARREAPPRSRRLPSSRWERLAPFQNSYLCLESAGAVSAVRHEWACAVHLPGGPEARVPAKLPQLWGRAPNFPEAAGPSAPAAPPAAQGTPVCTSLPPPLREHPCLGEGSPGTTPGRPGCPLAPVPVPTARRAVARALLRW